MVKKTRVSFRIALVACICGAAGVAIADVQVSPRFPITELRAANGSNTAGSFAAASVMGAQGFSNTAPAFSWEAAITSACGASTSTLPQASKTVSGTGPSIWPSGCNPEGMALALNQSPAQPHWIRDVFADTDQASAINVIVSEYPSSLHSPVLVPLWGSADHWATIVGLVLTDAGAIKTFQWRDAGPPSSNAGDVTDAAGNMYTYAGQLPVSYNANAFKNTYFKTLTAINPSCDTAGCSNDPYFGKYVLMYEPPAGQTVNIKPTVFATMPGLTGPQQPQMSPQVAQMRVFDALSLAGIDQQPETWNAISATIPGAAFEVHGVFPSGAPWNYFLVPMQTAVGSVRGFVQLDANDGSFQTIYPFATDVSFTPVELTKAQEIARDMLVKGETLGTGNLTWNAMLKTSFGKSPTNPYYEFNVFSAASATKPVGVIRVTLNQGNVTRS